MLECLSDHTYLIKIKDEIEQIHVRRLIPYVNRDNDPNPNIPKPLNTKSELFKIGREIDNNINVIFKEHPTEVLVE